jgi:integrase
MLRQAMNYAVRLELIASSPVSKIRLLNVDNREERLMSKKELSRLISALNKEENKTFALVVKFLLFTGARVSEALNARWTDIDRDQKTWKILAMNSKSKTRRAAPLSDSAIAVLDQLKTEGKSEWLFTSSRGGGRLTTISKRWIEFRSRKDVDLPSTRLHDLRHMHASMLINSGHSLYVVQQVLGHSDPSVSARYSHLSTATLQAAANSVGTYVEDALETDGK